MACKKNCGGNCNQSCGNSANKIKTTSCSNVGIDLTKDAITVKENTACSELPEIMNLGIKAPYGFKFPAVDATVEVFLDSDHKLGNIGSGDIEVYVPGFGYLEIVSYVPEKDKLILRNSRAAQTANANQHIPIDTIIYPTAPAATDLQSGAASQFTPFTISAFTVPEIGTCFPIAVTNTNGLTVGGVVSIQLQKFTIEAIPSIGIIQICNNGDATPLAEVPGNVPIQQQSEESFCEAREVRGSVKLFGCFNGDENVQLVAPGEGYVAYSAANGTWGARKVVLPQDPCFTVVSDTTVGAGTTVGTSIFLNVDTTVPFTLNQGAIPGLEITISNLAFTVQQIVSSTRVRFSLTASPTSDITIPAGLEVCLPDCCDVLNDRVDSLQTRVQVVETNLGIETPCPTQIAGFDFQEGSTGTRPHVPGAQFETLPPIFQSTIVNSTECDWRVVAKMNLTLAQRLVNVVDEVTASHILFLYDALPATGLPVGGYQVATVRGRTPDANSQVYTVPNNQPNFAATFGVFNTDFWQNFSLIRSFTLPAGQSSTVYLNSLIAMSDGWDQVGFSWGQGPTQQRYEYLANFSYSLEAFNI